MTTRERDLTQGITASGVTPSQVGIGRDDDVPWATFHNGDGYITVAAEQADSDEAAATEIARQAIELGILSN